MAAGKPEKALCILQRIAKENNKELPPGELVATEKHEVYYIINQTHVRDCRMISCVFLTLKPLTVLKLYSIRFKEEE